MRRRDTLDPAVAADLAALDAAVAGAPGADPALVALAADVRGAAPRPTPAFRARLDDRVAAGFPPAVAALPPAPAPAPRRLPRAWRGALAPVAALLAALVVAGGLGLRARSGAAATEAPSPAVSGAPSDRGSASGGGTSSGSGAESQARSSAPDAAAPAVPPLAAPGAAATDAAPGRRVERSTRLELGTTAGRFASVTDGVVRATQRAGGFVASSQLQQAGGGGDATFVLRVPAGRLSAAVADLSRLAHVRSIEQATADLTGAVDRTTAALRD